MKKTILSLVAVLSVGAAFLAGTHSKASAATYAPQQRIHTLPGGDCGTHAPQH